MAILFYWPLELRFLSVSTLSFLIWTTLESSQILLSGHPHPLHTLHLFLSVKGTWGEMAISNFILFPFILPFWRKIYFLPLFSSLGFPDNSVKESAYSVGDLGSIPGLRWSPGERKGYPLQYSGLENSMDCIVYGVAKSRTWLSDFHSFSLSHLINRNSGEFQRACSE